MPEIHQSQAWSRIGTALRAASAVIAGEPKNLAPLKPPIDEALVVISKPPSAESIEQLKYLLIRMDEFIAPWRPNPVPTPGVLYIEPNWAKNTDREVQEALRLLEGVRPLTFTVDPAIEHIAEDAMKVFVSHSSADKDVASAFVELLRASLPVPARDIRCTSVDGYKLPAGADSDEQLRREVFESSAFIALLSPVSVGSIYVMFELGARWGAKKPQFPVMICGLDPSFLRPPLSAIHAANGTSESEVHQLIETLGGALELAHESPAVYGKPLRAFLSLASVRKEPTQQHDGKPAPRATERGQVTASQRRVLEFLRGVPDRIAENMLAASLRMNVNDLRLDLSKLEKRGYIMAQYSMNQPPDWWIEPAGTEYLQNES